MSIKKINPFKAILPKLLKKDLLESHYSKVSLAIFATIFAGIGGILVFFSSAASPNVTINGSVHYETMDGWGASINSHSWDNGNLRPVIDMLVDQQGSTIYRVVMEMTDWEQSNDNADPNTFNWTYYDPIYSGATTFDTGQNGANFADLWNTIDYLHQKGIPDSQIVLSFMGIGPSWNGGTTVNTTAKEDEWVEEVVSAAYYGYSHGHTFGVFSPDNEEDWGNNEGIIMSASMYADAMNKVAGRLDALGMSSVRLLGPETAGLQPGYMSAMAGYPAVMNKLDHFDSHNYGGNTGNADTLAAGYGKNFWLSEFSIFDQVFTFLDGNPNAMLMWDAYDSVYNHAILNGLGSQPGNDAGNAPAMIAYNASTKVYTPRKSFYQFGQLFKYVPIGSQRIDATTTNGSIAVDAFVHASSSRLTIVGENTSASSQTLTIALNNISNLPATLSYFQTNTSSNMAQGADVSTSGGTATVTIPASTVFTLTGMATPDTQAPTTPTNLNATGGIGSASLSWTASTDNVGVTAYNIYRSTTSGFTPGPGNKITSTAATTYSDTGLSNGTYYYVITAQDAAGNVSGASAQASATVTSDTQAPTVSLTAPAAGTVSGVVTVSANASDNVGVVGVQFKLDGANLSSEDTLSPYSISWDTATASNGSHTLTAVARDASGNSTTSSSVVVTVSNTVGATLLGSQTIQATNDSNGSGDAEAFSYTAASSGTAVSISFYVASGNGATSLKLGIYSNNGGHPGTLLTSGTISSPVVGWNTLTLTTTPAITSGTVYWIGFLGTGGTLNYRDASSGNCSESDSATGLSSLPATWSSGQSWPSCSLSAYVSAALGGGSGKVGDLNSDNLVDILDLSILLSHWQQSGSGVTGDLNNDATVNIFDLSILLSHYGT